MYFKKRNTKKKNGTWRIRNNKRLLFLYCDLVKQPNIVQKEKSKRLQWISYGTRHNSKNGIFGTFAATRPIGRSCT